MAIEFVGGFAATAPAGGGGTAVVAGGAGGWLAAGSGAPPAGFGGVEGCCGSMSCSAECNRYQRALPEGRPEARQGDSEPF
jgi:hypothetical protein